MASISDMLAGVQTALTSGLFASTNVFYAFDPSQSLSYPPTDQFCVIQPNDLRVSSRAWTGAPATPTQNTGQAYLWTLTLTLWLFVRLATDEAHRDTTYLSDTTYGSLAITDQIVNTLQNYTLVATPENIGYKLEDISWSNKDRNTLGWSYTKLKYTTSTSSRS